MAEASLHAFIHYSVPAIIVCIHATSWLLYCAPGIQSERRLTLLSNWMSVRLKCLPCENSASYRSLWAIRETTRQEQKAWKKNSVDASDRDSSKPATRCKITDFWSIDNLMFTELISCRPQYFKVLQLKFCESFLHVMERTACNKLPCLLNCVA